MFEQALLRPAPVRGWAVTLAFAGEVLLVSCALMAPLVWPQLLPKAGTLTSLFVPSRPPSETDGAPRPHVRPMRPWRPDGATFYLQTVTQPAVTLLDDPPQPGLGVEGSTTNRELNFLQPVVPIVRPKQPPEPVVAAVVKPAPAPPRTIRISGPVQAARLVRRVEPLYPPIAREMRVSGTVELTGLIGTGGRIRELHVASGHPLLVRAALDAVSQWIYQPTLLNGEPVEVITSIKVVFRLN